MTERAGRPRLYALVDLARAPQLSSMMHWLFTHKQAFCLFEGKLPDEVLRVSPFIVDLASAPQLLDWWLAEGRGQSCGVFLEAALPIDQARRHVRRFLQVKLPDGSGPVLLRFWDPRVLIDLLRHCDAAQASQLFAHDVAYGIERDPECCWRIVRKDGVAHPTPYRWPTAGGWSPL